MDYINEKLTKLKYKEITPIQKEFFLKLKDKQNIVGISKTGTGKTHAYLLPILAKIQKDKDELQFMIVVPTNELVFQVTKMIQEVDGDFNVASYFGGIDKQKEINKLSKRQPQILVSIPNKILEFSVYNNALKIHTARFVCFDEADMMFDESFMREVDLFIDRISKATFIMMSATIKPNMEPFIKKYFGNYLLIDKSEETKLNINYHLIKLRSRTKIEGLDVLLEEINPYLCLIFVSKKEDQKPIFEHLLEKKYQVLNYSSNTPIKVRKRLIDDIVMGKYQYVVVSDLVARGVDFKASDIIHFDLPSNMEFFYHRSGRTGRMNQSGNVYVLEKETDNRKIDSIKKSGIKFIEYVIDGSSLKKMERKKKNNSEIIEAIQRVKKPTKIAPNYKKKNKKRIEKIKKELRRDEYAKNRKSR
ncbi:DEAD/DEAH box helicase [Acholeplasma sp. OttesenSCG-928-E16]|nr:DEAD/DEAH box helicase [Acholeplasma sp. OttesenSCG-928-E16]